MKRRTVTGATILVIMTILVVIGAARACIDRDGSPRRIVICGSSCMEDVCMALGEAAQEEIPGLSVEVQLGGSSMGIENARSGLCEIGASSRWLRPGEDGLAETLIAVDAVAVVVNGENPLNDLTLEQLRMVFTGQIKNWRELGGEDLAIVVIGREAGSGTRSAFEELTGTGGACRYGREMTETGMVLTSVETTRGAIGYLSWSYAGKRVKPLGIDGVKPTDDAVRGGSYRLVRPFLLLTRQGGEDEIVERFLSFSQGPQGRQAIKGLGLIPAGEIDWMKEEGVS